METSTYVYIALVSICILIVILIILQIVWIRSRLESIQNQGREKELTMKTEISQRMDVKNRLQIYSLIVDAYSTSILNNPTFRYFKELKPFFAPKIMSLPYVCGNGVWSKQTMMNKAGILITDMNHGALALQEDILQDSVKYIIINSQMFLVDMPRKDDLKEKIISFDLENISSVIYDRCIFILYPVKSSYNTMVDVDDGKCSVEINTFLGSVNSMDFDKSDMGTVIGFGKSTSMMPTHVLGYKLT